jgi:pimeloyl-ACP methyl ester carboxylesterase
MDEWVTQMVRLLVRLQGAGSSIPQPGGGELMADTNGSRPLLGLAACASVVAALAVATAALLRLARQRRLALARRVCPLTQEAVAGLGVPAVSQFVLAGDLQLHTILAGPEDGPLALLLHGFPESWYSWRHQIPVLVRAGYRVAVPDQRGYNLSDRPRGLLQYQIDRLTGDILALIGALGCEKATIIAHDWGGAAAWRFAMDHPQAVEHLVVMNAPHPVVFAKALRSDWSQRARSWYMAFFQLPWLPEALLTLSPMASARLLFRRTAVRRQAFSGDDLAVLAAAIAQPGAMECMINWYRAAFRFPPAKKARPIDAPTLLIWAEDDFALGMPLTYGLERWVPGIQIHYISRCGHWVQNEAPAEVNQLLLGFLPEGA